MSKNDVPIELTILMPCLNEAETLATCISKAKKYLSTSNVSGEVLIADNGSTDNSIQIAESLGATVINVAEKGYGSALIAGINAAKGIYVIMGDADDSYDFENLDPFVAALRAGNELVMGNRFAGGIEKGAMPPLHRYLGNPVLSGIGKIFFKTDIGDFHCGLRGFNRDSMLKIGLNTSGMEFASEMVVRSILAGLKITEVPTTLKKDGRTRPPHLRSWHDGWRHLKFLFAFSPKWLFFIPGIVSFTIGVLVTLILAVRDVQVGQTGFSIATQIYASSLAVIGYQAILFSVLARVYARSKNYLIQEVWLLEKVIRGATLEKGLLVGVFLLLIGVSIGILQLMAWASLGWGNQNPTETIRIAIPATLFLIIGAQTIQTSALYGVFNTNES